MMIKIKSYILISMIFLILFGHYQFVHAQHDTIGNEIENGFINQDYPLLNNFQPMSLKNQYGDDVTSVELSYLKIKLNDLLNDLLNRLTEQTIGLQLTPESKIKTVPVFMQLEKIVNDIDEKANLYLTPQSTLLLIEFIHHLFSQIKSEFPHLSQKQIFDRMNGHIKFTSLASIFQYESVHLLIETNPIFYPEIITKLKSSIFKQENHLNRQIQFHSISTEFQFSSYKLYAQFENVPKIYFSINEQKLTGPDLDDFLTKILHGEYHLALHQFPSNHDGDLNLSRLTEYVQRYNDIQDRIKSWNANRQQDFSEENPYWLKLDSLIDYSKLSCRQLFLSQ